ncbi:transporter substrate-binding domain-containing protein [Ruminococcaceae bacterium OttesenSCG-928-D13]|nr:transporter substrate-binding domain-containing protein [Ruminococcaceae bacterium OttesenSCG-928-D13]
MRRILCAVFAILAGWLLLAPVSTRAISITLRVGVNINLPPYQFEDDGGKVSGLHIDIMDAVADKCGLIVEYVPFQNTWDAMQAMGENELDIVLGVPSKKYGSASSIHSDSINTSALCLVASNRTAAIYSRPDTRQRVVVALESDTIDYNYMTSMDFISTVMRDNQASAYQAMQDGYADMLVGVRDSVIYQLRADKLEDNYTIITNHMATVNYGIAAHGEDAYLVTLINRGLAELHTTGEYDALYSRWSMVDDNSVALARLKTVLLILAAVIVAIVIYFIIVLRIKKMLEKEVALRTSDLNNANEQVRVMNLQLEQKISQREAYSRLLDSIIEASPIAMLLLDSHGNMVHGNSHAGELMKQLESDEVLFAGGGFSFRQMIESCMAPSAPADQTGNLVATYPDREQHNLRYSVHRLREDDASSRLLVTLEDVTAETIAQDAKYEKRKNKALNNMIASIAHEVKNPLTTISAAVDMVYSKRNDLTFMEAFREVVPQEVDRINRLVQNLVYYARPARTASERLDVGQLVAALERLTEPLAQKNDVLLDIAADGGLFVLASRDKLTQVLLNFVMNSLESIDSKLAEPPGNYTPCVRVRAKRLDQFVSITVWDNGIGMGEAQIKACIQPFFTTKAAGTGLGLPVSAQYISEVGGVLQIDGKPDEYALLTMFLPIMNSDDS